MWPFNERYPDGVWRCIDPGCEFETEDVGEASEHDASGRGHATVWSSS